MLNKALNYICKKMSSIVWSVEKIQKIKIQNL